MKGVGRTLSLGWQRPSLQISPPWQGRFSSCAMDEAHALTAVRYVELNPVKARLSPWE